MRQIFLDTETTGLDVNDGHRIIEIACIETIHRKRTARAPLHFFLQPDRDIDEGALSVHGISREFLADKPRFPDVAETLIDYLRDAEVLIHNAPFDLGFINMELARIDGNDSKLEDFCKLTDTLALAREISPGLRNNLDALCKRYNVDNSARAFHGALLDADLLIDVYHALTGGQVDMLQADAFAQAQTQINIVRERKPATVILHATAEETAAHRAYLELLEKTSGGKCLWLELERQDGNK